jgi:hypothetical protein
LTSGESTVTIFEYIDDGKSFSFSSVIFMLNS